MDSLKDLLLSKNLDQPSELKSIQDFLERNLEFPFGIKDYPKHVTISVGNSKIAYLVRTKLPALEAFAAPTKDIHIRIDGTLDIR
jgi:hypothetical protein